MNESNTLEHTHSHRITTSRGLVKQKKGRIFNYDLKCRNMQISMDSEMAPHEKDYHVLFDVSPKYIKRDGPPPKQLSCLFTQGKERSLWHGAPQTELERTAPASCSGLHDL